MRAARSLTRLPAPAAASAEEALHFAETIGRSCSAALGATVAGVILHGSSTLDDDVPVAATSSCRWSSTFR